MYYTIMKPKKEPLKDIMEHIKPPKVDVTEHQNQFRVTLLNTKKSAIVGALFLILPLLFLSGVLLNHYMKIDFGTFTSVYHWVSDLDQQYGDSSFLNWIIRFLLLFGPLIAIGINLLSICHIRFEKPTKELIMSLKLKWVNLLIIGICTLILVVFFSYMLVENSY